MIHYENEDEIIRKYASRGSRRRKSYHRRDRPDLCGTSNAFGESGFTEYDGWTCTIAVNSKDGPQRSRFTAAHELGHLVLHRDLLKEHRHLDRLFDEAARRNPSKPLVYSHELQANQFAARLLMPEQTIKSEIQDGLRTVGELARSLTFPARLWSSD